MLDNGITVFFEGPRSFTGEDVAELHVHGGKAVVAAVLSWLGEQAGFRQAEAGEFTRRAFLNGKMDLTGAEALADLVSSETEAQRKFALEGADGRQARLYGGWRSRILRARTMVEAELDFADESDVGAAPSSGAWPDLRLLADDIGRHVASFPQAEIIREGYQVVILGAPNAGKSSLLNALARRDVAIVTEEAGTTRDLIEVSLDLGGFKVVLTDTAGLRKKAGRVETIGIERALKRAERADLVLVVIDLAEPVDVGPVSATRVLRVGTKADIGGNGLKRGGFDHVVSSVDGTGLGGLMDQLSLLAADAAGGDRILPARLRHVELLRSCVRHLEAAMAGAEGLELQAEELRLASEMLGRIVGAVDVEELLGSIFSNFCIGK